MTGFSESSLSSGTKEESTSVAVSTSSGAKYSSAGGRNSGEGVVTVFGSPPSWFSAVVVSMFIASVVTIITSVTILASSVTVGLLAIGSAVSSTSSEFVVFIISSSSLG